VEGEQGLPDVDRGSQVANAALAGTQGIHYPQALLIRQRVKHPFDSGSRSSHRFHAN
jgi:hypothetical protein